jgi:hypothetical protein
MDEMNQAGKMRHFSEEAEARHKGIGVFQKEFTDPILRMAQRFIE